MDNMDEFEFKPITEGLGFHNKRPEPPQPSRNAGAAPSGFGSAVHPAVNRIAGIPSPTRSGLPPLSQNPASLRKPSTAVPKAGTLSPQYDVRRELEKGLEQQIRAQVSPRRQIANEVSVLPAAILFDSIVVVGLACLFTVIVLLVAEVDFMTVLISARTDMMTAISLGILMLSVLELYTVVFRSIFGFTLGEWAFDAEIGTDEQRKQASFPLRIVARAIVTGATGFVLLPLISLIAGKDIAGRISGVSLHRI